MWSELPSWLELSCALKMSLMTYCIEDLDWRFLKKGFFFVALLIFLLISVVFVILI